MGHKSLSLLLQTVGPTAFSFLSSSRFRGRMLCCLCLLASLTFSVATSNWWSVSQSDPGYVRQFIKFCSIFVQLRCSLSDSGCRHQERSRYTAALDVVWTCYWLQPTCAPTRSLLAAHRLHLFLLSHTAQPSAMSSAVGQYVWISRNSRKRQQYEWWSQPHEF